MRTSLPQDHADDPVYLPHIDTRSQCFATQCIPIPHSAQECCEVWISLGRSKQEDAHAPHPRALLGARVERPGGRAAKQSDELASPHSITSSASCWRCSGTSSLIDLAVLR